MVSTTAVPWARIAVFACVLLAGPACGGPAVAAMAPTGVVRAAAYPPSAPSIAASSSTACDGCQDTVTVVGFMPGSTVQFTLHSTGVSLGSAVVDGDGDATFTFRIPSGTAPGEHTITASGTSASGGSQTLRMTILVTVATSPGTLAHTGASVLVPAEIGVAAAGAGGGLVLLGRRRRTSKTAKR